MISLNELFVLPANERQSELRALPAIAIADAGWPRIFVILLTVQGVLRVHYCSTPDCSPDLH